METHSITDSCIDHYAQHFFDTICVEVAAAERVLRQLYLDGPKCASCGAAITGSRAVASFWRGDRTHCAGCNSKFSPRANTILAECHLTYAKFEIICVLLSLGVDHPRIATMTKVHVDTISIWHSKIKFWESHA